MSNGGDFEEYGLCWYVSQMIYCLKNMEIYRVRLGFGKI